MTFFLLEEAIMVVVKGGSCNDLHDVLLYLDKYPYARKLAGLGGTS
jgi:hypothetical protein